MWYAAAVRLGRAITSAALAFALGCGGGEGELRVAENPSAGELGYVRCLASSVSSRSWTVGALQLRIDQDRRMRIEGAPVPARLAAFTGPVDRAGLDALRAEAPHVAILLGDLGTSRGDVDRTLTAVAGLGVPVFVIAGGTDRLEVLEPAFDALEGSARDRLVHASPLRSIRLGSVELVPLAGAPLGRYAETSRSCGFGEGDVERLADTLGTPPEGAGRVVVSWAGPEGSAGLGGLEAGSALVSRLEERVRAQGVIFAWPVEGAGSVRSSPLRIGVRPLGGSSLLVGHGARVSPGATLLTVGPEGLSPPPNSP